MTLFMEVEFAPKCYASRMSMLSIEIDRNVSYFIVAKVRLIQCVLVRSIGIDYLIRRGFSNDTSK